MKETYANLKNFYVEGFTMKNTKKVVYMVTYLDDENRKHMTFVEGFSAVKFLEDRFTNVYFERTEMHIQATVE